MLTFNIYQDQAGQYRWRLVAENGRIVADSSEGYVSKSNVKRIIETIKQDVAVASVAWHESVALNEEVSNE